MRTWLTTIALFSLAVLMAISQGNPASAAFSRTEIEQINQSYRAQGFVLDWDLTRGLPRKMVNATFRPPQFTRIAGSPEQLADAFLISHAATLFGRTDVAVGGAQVTSGNQMELRTMRVVESLSGFQVWKLQYVDGLPVDDAWVQTNLDKQGRILSVLSKFQPTINIPDPAPALSGSLAIDAARASIDRPGAERVAPTAELVIWADGASGVLAYKTMIPLWSPYGDWESIVSAQTGQVIFTQDRMIYRKGPNHERIDIAPPPTQAHVEGQAPAPRAGVTVTGSGMVMPANPLNGHPERYALRDGDNVDPFRETKSLFRLDGSGFLKGSYCWADNTDVPPGANEPSEIFNYSVLTLNGHFEEVNIYWHIDAFQDYIQTSLGIPNANNRQTKAHAHQGEDDNSSYSPATKEIRYGDGGVDDSEDGEVVLHEYGHAIHDNIVPGFGGGETGAISEGFGDYCAGTFGDNALIAEWDATSYNPGPPPNLRRIDGTKHYPEDLDGEVHDDGEIISAAWWQLHNMVGKQVADQLIIESFFLTGTSSTMPDFADATVQVDMALFGGAHLGAIYSSYGSRGIGPAYLLEITHAPLGDTENRTGPYAVNVTIAHTSPITGANAVQMHWKLASDPSFTDVTMSASGPDAWTADIPGPGVDATIQYYLNATDDQSVGASLPATAPGTVFSFNVGTDLVPPTIAHTPLNNQPTIRWPSTVRAAVTDNLGVAAVSVSWSLNSVLQAGFALVHTSGNNWEAHFPAVSVVAGDAIDYTITAVDGSSAANYAYHGPHSFQIINALGVVLILDDDHSAKAGGEKLMPDKTTVVQTQDRAENEKGLGAGAMAAVLTNAGYVVTVEESNGSDPSTWSSYDVVISSSGRDNSPLANAAYRTALVNYVQAGHKLFVEGGEVGFDSTFSPFYPEIADNVIHAFDWDTDNAGPLVGSPGQAGHPIRNIPNPLSASIPVTYAANFGDEDATVPNPEAYLVYGTTSFPADAGVLVYDNNNAPGSAQIVYLAAAYVQITDPSLAGKLLENIVAYLLADEGSAASSISGQVVLQNSVDFSGSVVTAHPGGATATTGANGQYALNGLFPGTYTLEVQGPAGWESTSRTLTIGTGATTDVNFELRPVTQVTICNSTPINIPDNNPTGIVSTLLVGTGGGISDVHCAVNITHTWKGDLTIDLVSPNGTSVRLHNRTGGSTDNVITSYDDLTLPDGPGVMNDFNGGEASGTWQLKVADRAGQDVGTLNNWCVTLLVTQQGSVPTLAGALRAQVADGGVRVSWTTYSSEGVTGFNVLRQVGASSFTTVNSEMLHPKQGEMSFVDAVDGIAMGTSLTYRLEAVLVGGSKEIVGEDVRVQYAPQLPAVFALHQNEPNPFNPKTTIRFALPATGYTTLRVYDSAGRLVTTLVSQVMGAGVHPVVWGGTDDRGQTVASGTYFYQVRSGRYIDTKRMELIK
jgi:subtilisin-like proprotein convertase family protein